MISTRKVSSSLPLHLELPDPIERQEIPTSSCEQLRAQFTAWHAPMVIPGSARKILFAGVSGRDVYNITAPFEIDGRWCLAGRVERRDSELAETLFFQKDQKAWVPVPHAPVLSGLQDPCVTFIHGQLVVGGVRFPIELPSGEKIWRMEFYRGDSLDRLERFLIGPDKMKDIRLKELADGRVAVFSRPQGEKGGRGRIGLAIASSLEQVSAKLIETAPLLKKQFLDMEWGGANEIHLLSNGKLGVLGHVACFDERESRHYYSMAFCLDVQTGQQSGIKMIASRDCFPPGATKRPDLIDVVFTGGLVRHGDGTATLYAGLSDAEAGCVMIADPFVEYES